MKNWLFKIKLLSMVTVVLAIGACSDDFLDRPPEDSFNAAEFYGTPEQVEASTNALYSIPWYDFVSNVSWCIGDLASGTGRTWDPRNQDFDNFAITGEHNTLGQAWTSLYAVIAQANAVINAVPLAATGIVPESTINTAVGEARALRAIAYFYLVRIFGAVPIIEDNTLYVDQSSIPRNVVDDVYRFIIEDLEFAAANITYTKTSAPGRISSNGAKAMLAKVHLTRRNYQAAYNLSAEVIQSNEFDLMENYGDLFITANDNNIESVIALQWTGSGEYAEGNAVQSLYALPNITGFSDGWSAIGPSLDLQDSYEDHEQDDRYHATIMDADYYYSEINGGYTVPNNVNAQGTLKAIKKYVVGKPEFIGGGAMQSYPNNTYILRYADVLLIHAESIIMGGGGSVGEAETSINKVRERAGLAPLTNPVFEDVFQERKIEFALEMEHWYDVIRMDTADAIEYLSNVERGTWDDSQTPPVLNSKMVTVTADKLLFPYPTNETINNPALLEDPVKYYND
ncbi:RagB/SusD family nutrient uptake outer membrane protein [Abyssalbus ytuae]|uniref:RagB/SusD family nutrient uptake outer membrane protein n=1 Tax=Abyssalbus ytuae TaxID=2926907 RepID=A0A9E6ZLD3_9FLAO|nr:RagB/SusD family nutrient uptake outer membrane protein [Abyssalbus ytuae]UOB16744.1 RagB/SusD family nutrient uptake outer membrane protein [Abyssalbus ytuae]